MRSDHRRRVVRGWCCSWQGGIGMRVVFECTAPLDPFHLFPAPITDGTGTEWSRTPLFDTLVILVPTRHTTLTA